MPVPKIDSLHYWDAGCLCFIIIDTSHYADAGPFSPCAYTEPLTETQASAKPDAV